MIEVTIADLFLFVWGVIATVGAFHWKEQNNYHKYIIHKLLTDDKLRNEMVSGYQKATGKLTT